MSRLLRLLAIAAAAVLPALLAAPGRAAAQAGYQCIECDTLPPSVTITPGTGTVTNTASVSVTVDFRDPSALQANTRSFVLDSTTDVTTSFSYGVVSGGAVSTGTLTLTQGRHTLTAAITDLTGLTGHRTVVYTYTVPAPPVARPPAVTPDLAPVQRTQNEPVTDRFLVTNPGTAPGVYTLWTACSSVASGCTPTQARIALAGMASASVGVSYRASNTIGASGAVQLFARDSASLATDSGSVQVSVIASRPTSYTNDVGTDVWMPRSACLRLPAGLAGSYECGDLRLSYALPATAAMGRTFAPTLLYSSAHARPTGIVSGYAHPLANTQPASMRLILRFTEGDTLLSPAYSAAGWASTDIRRIGVMYDASASSHSPATYVRNYTAQFVATNTDGTTQVIGSGNGSFALVDRRSSPFHNGWWLAGLEQLYPQLDGTFLWVGGDGSTERYTRAAPGDSVYLGDAMDGPDSLVKRTGLDTLVYERRLGGGAAVWYDAEGYHRRTCNRLRQCTAFQWSTDRKLTRIWLPTPAGWDSLLAYTFTYGNVGGRLSRVDAPGGRATTLYSDDGRIQYIDNPANERQSFGYNDATGKIVYVVNARGTMTYWRYGTEGKLTSAYVALPLDSIVVRYSPQEVLGLVAPVPLASVYTFFDGPRLDADVHDYAWFWADRRGTPWQVKDALGNVTRAYRADPKWQALNTRVVYPNGREVTATYDDAGRLVASTDWSVTSADGRHATTLNEWDTRWNDVARITQPEGETTTIAYDSATGLRAWQQAGDSVSRRVTFDYYPLNDARAPGRVRSVTTQLPDGAAVESYTYDDRGNLRSTRTPLGFYTLHYADAIGRDTMVVTPLDADSATDTTVVKRRGTVQRVVYDVLGRDTLSRTIGPARSDLVPLSNGVISSPAQTVTVRSHYDRGLLEHVDRWSSPDTAHVDTLTTRWRYDAAGRKLAEVAPGPPGTTLKDSTVYDPAGNVIEVINRLGERVTLRYDALNRLVRREVPPVTRRDTAISPLGTANPNVVWAFPLFHANAAGAMEDSTPQAPVTAGSTFSIPGDTATFTYDPMGNLLSAVNRDASVTRSWSTNGLLLSEMQRIRTYVGQDTTRHAYRLQYAYDLDGRRTQLTVPDSVAPSTGQKTQQYTFVGGTGELRRIVDVLGNTYDYSYDGAGRLSTFIRNGVRETYGYDDDGRMSWRREDHLSSGLRMHDDAMTYDARGKLLTVATRDDTYINRYSGLGALRASYTVRTTQALVTADERFGLDALGNRYSSVQRLGGGTQFAYASPPDTSYSTYEEWTGRLHWNGGENTRGGPAFDAAGNQVSSWTGTVVTTPYNGQCSSGHNFWGLSTTCASGVPATLVDGTYQYYGADGKLRITDHRTCLVFDDRSPLVCDPTRLPLGNQRSAFEEYRYDALGRRVLVRSRQAASCAQNCQNLVRRVIWDGDQVLAEIQAPARTGQSSALMESDSYLARVNSDSLAFPTLSDTARIAYEDTVPHAVMDGGFHFGKVLYTHGPGIDAPLSLVRMLYSDSLPQPKLVVLHSDWRGEYDMGSYAFGSLAPPCKTMSRSSQFRTYTSDGSETAFPKTSGTTAEVTWRHCLEVEWPAPHVWINRQTRNRSLTGPVGWVGTLLDGMRDNSGQMYMRNRYYDPASGRFTQEDPIGLAGGLNAYGFAGGDPVSSADPSGLRVCAKDARIRRGVERAVEAAGILWDSEGCVSSSNQLALRSTRDPGMLLNQVVFVLMVESPETFMLAWNTGGMCKVNVACFDDNVRPFAVWLDPNNSDEYVDDEPSLSGGSWYLTCDRDPFPFRRQKTRAYDLAGMISHELLDHGAPYVLPGLGSSRARGHSPDALVLGNNYHRYHHQRLRCGG